MRLVNKIKIVILILLFSYAVRSCSVNTTIVKGDNNTVEALSKVDSVDVEKGIHIQVRTNKNDTLINK